MTQGNASEAPASALVPMRPRKNPSNVITPAKASKVRTLGAARRSSVGRIGPSSSSLVRARSGSAFGSLDEGGIDASVAHEALLSRGGALGRRVFFRGRRAGRLQGKPDKRETWRIQASPQTMISWPSPKIY